jgi:hypothetical protein
MLHTVIRVGEVVNLRLTDVYLSENRPPHLRVIGKGQRERVAYLSTTAALLLKEYLSERSDKTEEKVFLNRRGKSITTTGIQLQLAKYCHKANIWINCHQLRHTFACRMIAAEVPVTSVQKMLGHSSIRTTQLYVNVADVHASTAWSMPEDIQSQQKPCADIFTMPERLNEVPEWLRTPVYRFLRLKQRNWPAKTVRRSTRQLFSRLNHITTFFIQHYGWSEWQQLAPHRLEDYFDARDITRDHQLGSDLFPSPMPISR